MPVNHPARNLRFLLLLTVILLLLVGIDYLGGFAGVDTYFYDTFLRLRGQRHISDRIVIVAVDAKTLNRYGQWPIKRHYYAELLKRLDQAAVVGFDLLLQEPTFDDAMLATAIAHHGRVFLPVYLEKGGVAAPLERFVPRGLAHIHIELGVDNTARSLFHSIYYSNRLLPSLSSGMYEAFTGQPFRRLTVPARSTTVVLQQDSHLINYYGPPGTFPQVSLVDLLDEKVPAANFAGKLVLVGLTVPGILDEVSTPLSQTRKRMSGVEVHANILNNLLDRSAIKELSTLPRTAAVLVLALLLAVIQIRGTEKQAVLLWLASQLVVLISVFALLAFAQYWVSPALMIVSFSVVALAVYLYRLDSAARKLDHEYEVMSALLGRDGGEGGQRPTGEGLFSFLSAGGINAKIGRQLGMIAKLLELHRQLESALKSEREALDNQIRFVEMLSHEYRTPLAIIRANLDILEMKDSTLGGQLSGNFSKMKRAMARLVEVMDTSLDRERLEETRSAKVLNEELDLEKLLVTLLDESRELWAERDFEQCGDGCADCFVYGDRLLLRTAILNLIDNAVKYSAKSQPVQVFLEKQAGRAVIAVVNHGAVIAQEELQKVFDKFYRGGSSANTRGAGLGLYLVRKIVEQSGGRVMLTSDVTQNSTTATIFLPLHHQHPSASVRFDQN